MKLGNFPSLEGRIEENILLSLTGVGQKMNREQNPERSVATKDAQGTEADNKKSIW
jgi:hypothetical protein